MYHILLQSRGDRISSDEQPRQQIMKQVGLLTGSVALPAAIHCSNNSRKDSAHG